VIREKCQKHIGMRVQPIASQYIGNAAHGRAAQKHVSHREEHRIIKQRVQAGIDTVETSLPTSEKRRDAGIGMKHFANRRQIRISLVQPRVPI
jgi:hypothetical protein